jgi:uncharacterized protein (DUF1800 family)
MAYGNPMHSSDSRSTLRATRLIVVCTVAIVLAPSWPGTRVTAAAGSSSAVPSNPGDKTIVHVLNRLGFGAMPGDVERVRRIGLEKYIDQQLRPETIADAAMGERLAGLNTLALNSRQLAQDYFIPAQVDKRQAKQQSAAQPTEAATDKRDARTPEQMQAMQAQRQVFTDLAQQKVLRAVYSERQLNEVLVDFWFNHFNVFAGKGLTRNYLTEYERDAIRPHVLGKFRDLLEATAKSPAMLFYLDNWQSAAPEGARTAAPPNTRNAVNRQRPLMPRKNTEPHGSQNNTEQHRRMLERQRTIADLPPNAQNKRPRGLNENYARELMELHTLGVDGGYTQKDVQEVARALTGWTIANPRQGGGFVFEPRMHDDGEKIVLGHKIKAGGGQHDGEEVLDILASHPSTAHFIATKLVRRFVSDEPPAALVDRAAERFRETKGDIREVVRTIVTSREFFAPEAYRAKVKTPFEFVASAARATSADSLNAMPLVQAMRELGMPPYQCQPPTGYADRAEAWVNTGALLNRMNFAVALTEGRMRGVRAPTIADGRSVDNARDEIAEQVLAGDVSASTRATVAKASRPAQAVALLLGSPEFQRR